MKHYPPEVWFFTILSTIVLVWFCAMIGPDIGVESSLVKILIETIIIDLVAIAAIYKSIQLIYSVFIGKLNKSKPDEPSKISDRKLYEIVLNGSKLNTFVTAENHADALLKARQVLIDMGMQIVGPEVTVNRYYP